MLRSAFVVLITDLAELGAPSSEGIGARGTEGAATSQKVTVLLIAVPVSFLEVIAAIVFAPFGRNVAFPATFG